MRIKELEKSIAFIVLFDIWMWFLWVSDMIVFDMIFEADYYWYVWPITIISHLGTIVAWFYLGKCKGINRIVFTGSTAAVSFVPLWIIRSVLSDKRFAFDFGHYLTSSIASFVPLVVVILSAIILIRMDINKNKI